eukprot:3223883-Rhodomonas_salina.1
MMTSLVRSSRGMLLILLVFCAQFSVSQSFLLLRSGVMQSGKGLGIAQSRTHANSGMRRRHSGPQHFKTRKSCRLLMKRGDDRDHTHEHNHPFDEIKFNRRAMLNTVWCGVGGIAGYIIRDKSDPKPAPSQQAPAAGPLQQARDGLKESLELKDAETEVAKELSELKALRQETEKEIDTLKEKMRQAEISEQPGEDTPLQKLVEILPFGFIAAALTAQ